MVKGIDVLPDDDLALKHDDLVTKERGPNPPSAEQALF
jgi:hypothetical protein